MKKHILAVVLFGLTQFALANQTHEQHAHHNTDAQLSEVGRAYMDSMASMHEDMLKGIQEADPDVAFAAGMLPHHQGAVAMAEIELKYGKDPGLRKLAEEIIKAQKAEIEFMQKWLAEHKK